VGNSLFGKRVGLFGFGGIGQAVASRLVPFKVDGIMYNCRVEKPDVAGRIGAKFVSFDQLVSSSIAHISEWNMDDECEILGQFKIVFTKTVFQDLLDDLYLN